ncbi:DUF2793 domain-containing protein [Aquabacter cavernae]|uniref:DUF2793 domain-containing protein n=1 Tax=Aquabacter cavernae TaxID=2496029 RepID=UPI00196B8F05|nr:DUF2793 domain-containing protein [Aquabacter cavernae]
MTVIKSGTVSIASGSNEVVGSGTTWASGPQPARPGDTFMAPGSAFLSTIGAVPSDTSLIVESQRAGAAIAGAAFEIRLDAPDRFSGVSAVASLNAMALRYEMLAANIRLPLVVSVGSNAPPGSPALGAFFVVGTVPTGAWAGYANQFAISATTGWRFEAPKRGDGVADQSTGDFFFWTGAAWVQRTLNAGALRYDGAQVLSGGQQTQALTNLGIPATTAGQVLQNIGGVLTARTVAQMLSGSTGVDFVAGTWSPSLGSDGADPNISYSNRSGWYLRIGRMVYVGGEITGTRSGGTGNARIGGMPFPGNNQPLLVRGSGINVPGTPFGLPSSIGVAWLQYSSAASGGAVDMNISAISSAFGLIIGGVYTS